MKPSHSGPLIPLTIANIVGILLGQHFHFDEVLTFSLLGTFTGAYFIFLKIYNPTSNLLLWMIALLILSTIGVYRVQKTSSDDLNFGSKTELESYRIFNITSSPTHHKGHQRFNAIATQIQEGTHWQTIKEKTIITTSLSTPLQYGDDLLAYYKPSRITNLNNPDEFDFAGFSALEGIYHQTYLDGSDVSLLKNESEFTLQTIANRLRLFLQSELQKHITNKQDFAIINAMVFGDKSLLDHEVKSNYASTGAMHILAVSGLHVGVLFLIIQFLTNRLPKSTKWRLITLLLTLGVLWAFALLTGLSSSVVRSALMFSIFQIGKTWQRQYHPLNALAFAALIMLLIDPNQLFSIGFQLSFIAVGGIVLIYPKLNALWVPPKYLNYFWQIICVSIAAQLVTTPISLYYFHQFPTYFLLTNLIIIPLSFIIVSLGVAFMTLCWIPFIGALIGKVLDYSAFILNSTIEIIGSWQFASITPINLTLPELILIYLTLIFTYYFTTTSRKLMIYFSVSCLILLIGLFAYDQIQRSETEEFVVYNTPKHSTISISEGNKFYVVTNDDNIPHQTQPHLQSLGHNPKQQNKLRIQQVDFANNKVLFWNDCTVAITNNIKELPTSHYDIIVVSNQALKTQTALSELHYDHLIFDGSNPKWYCEKWSEILTTKKTWFVSKQGAFIHPINSSL